MSSTIEGDVRVPDSLTAERETTSPSEPNIIPPAPSKEKPSTAGPSREALADQMKAVEAADEDNSPIAILIAVVLPFIGLGAAIFLTWGWGVTWVELSIMFGMYLFSGLGITIGFHRYFTHRSFETVRPIQYLLAIAGSTAMQGPMIRWVALHRRHHQHSDEEHDPHSPHIYGKGFFAILKGWFHAHMGWMWARDNASLKRYVADLAKDEPMARCSDRFSLWVLLGMLTPTLLGLVITGTLWGALLGFVWGGLVRLLLVQHVTWSINSVCHIWGSRPYKSDDESRNNPIFGILAFGEGWHNNHHAFPTSARHGLAWWQFDSSYLIIRTLEMFGLAWKVRLPKQAAMEAKRL